MPLLSRPPKAAHAGPPPGPASGPPSGPILRLGKTAPPAHAVVTVPGSQIPLLRLELPPGLRGQAREQVARRQLADRTGLSPDSLGLRPFVMQAASGQKTAKSGRGPQSPRTQSPRKPRPGTQNAGTRRTETQSTETQNGGQNWTRVLVGDSQYLQELQAITCRAVLPDYLTLPTTAGLWTLALEQVTPAAAETETAHRPLLLARLGPEDGFSAQPAIALAMLRQQLEHSAPEPPRPQAPHQTPPPALPQAILWTGPPTSPVLTEVEALARAHDIALVHSPDAVSAFGLAPPQVLAHGELACDLRHNPMAARAQMAAAVLPWRWPLLAGCLAAALWAAGELVQISRLEAEITTQERRNQALVKRHFVPEGPVLDARRQVSRALSALRQNSAATKGQGAPLALTARLAEVVTAGGPGADLRPELLRYRSTEGLLLALRLKDFAAVDQLLADLRQAGLNSTLTDSRVNEAESGVRAEFVITGITPSEVQP